MIDDINSNYTQKLRMGHQICGIGKEVEKRKDSRTRRVDACQGRDHRISIDDDDPTLFVYRYLKHIVRESVIKATQEAL